MTTGAITHAKLQSSQIITTNKPTSFLQAGCPSCRQTNSVKALKGELENTVSKTTPSAAGPAPAIT